MIHLGIDLGGSKIEIIALDDGGRELLRRRLPTPQGDYRATLATLARLVHEAEAELGEQGTVGIGTPGALSRVSGLLKNSNSVCLNGQPIQQDIEALLGRSVRIANDANCFALSEAVDGAGAGMDIVFGAILGTGVGGGVVVHGRVLTGANAIAGEWGHNPLPQPTAQDYAMPQCYCGRAGCIETYLSGPALARDYQAATGKTLSAQEIATRATTDAECAAALARYEERLARALAQAINLLDPDAIVLGGGLSHIAQLYDTVPQLWRKHVFSDHVATKLLRNAHGDSSGVRGAAWLWQ